MTETTINKNNSVTYIDRLNGEDSGMIIIVIIVAIRLNDEMLANEYNKTPITKNWDWWLFEFTSFEGNGK